MAKLLLGIDIGTYSSKGVLCQPDGCIIAEARVEHEMSIPKTGYAEHDADAVWWGDFVRISNELTAKIPKGEHLAGLGISAIGACVLPVDKEGKPLRPGILYGVDTRAIKQIEELERNYTRQELVDFSGSRLTTQSAGPKILWIKQNEPEVYMKTDKFVTATSYITHKLTGRYVIDAHTASEFSPLINIRTVQWEEKYSEEITTLDKLPNIGWSTEIAGYVTANVRKETGLPEGTPVIFGAVDALSEAISVGVVEPGELMVMYGSTAFMIFLINKPAPTHELWLECGAFNGQYCYSAGLSTSGSATTWFRDQFARDLLLAESGGGKNAYAALAEEARMSAPGANGLLFLPYMSGERTPIFDPKARGVFAGLSLSHTRGDMYRAILEGTAFAIRMNFEAMQKAGASISKAIAVGGGTANELWLQIVSDATGIPQLVPQKTIGASYGDAFLAGLAVGVLPGVDSLKKDWVSIQRDIIPDQSKKEDYDRNYLLFKELFNRSASVVHTLADSQP